jgi:hypothetical protein
MARRRSRTNRVTRKSTRRSTRRRSSTRRSNKSRRNQRKPIRTKSSIKLLEPRAESNKSKSKKKKSKKGPSPYNKFVKEMSPILRKANPGLKQPQIMKLIAEEWRKMPIPETD